MKRISVRDVLIFHEQQIKKRGGFPGIRDQNTLESAINRPFATFGGEDLYVGIFMKAAALLQSIVGNHPFLDANKRTGFVSTLGLLKLNGIRLIATQEESYEFIMKVATEHLSVDEIAEWLEEKTFKESP